MSCCCRWRERRHSSCIKAACIGSAIGATVWLGCVAWQWWLDSGGSTAVARHSGARQRCECAGNAKCGPATVISTTCPPPPHIGSRGIARRRRGPPNAVRRRPCAAHLAHHEWRLLGWTAAEAEIVRVDTHVGLSLPVAGSGGMVAMHALAQLGGQCGGSTVVARLWWLDSLGPTVCAGSTPVAWQRRVSMQEMPTGPDDNGEQHTRQRRHCSSWCVPYDALLDSGGSTAVARQRWLDSGGSTRNPTRSLFAFKR